MHKTLTAIAVAAMIGFTAIAIPNQAEARWRGGWWIPGAIVGGLALGAIASGAYQPYYYGPAPYYYGPAPYYGYYYHPYAYDPGPYDYGAAYSGGTHEYYASPDNRRYKHWTEF